MSAMVDAALDYAAAGYAVFRARERGKEPLTGLGGLHHATRDERTILHEWDRIPGANIGINCGASGIAVIDVDAKHGADPAEAFPALGLADDLLVAVVRTGEAPEPDAHHPRSLAGVRGAHAWFRGRAPGGRLDVPGCELRGDGQYVIAPPSAHPSGVLYMWHRRLRVPRVDELPPLPSHLRRARSADPPAPGVPILPGARHDALKALAVDLVRRGVVDAAVLRGALREVNRVRCCPPIDDAEVVRIAEWAPTSRIAGRERARDDFAARWRTPPSVAAS